VVTPPSAADMCDEEIYGELDSMSRRLEPIMTKLAKACLTSKPDDLDTFGLKFFASRLGIDPANLMGSASQRSQQSAVPPTPTRGTAADEDLDDDEEALEADYTAAIIRTKSRKTIVRKTNYESSDEDDAVSPGSHVTDEAAPKAAVAEGLGDESRTVRRASDAAAEDDEDVSDDGSDYAQSGRVESMVLNADTPMEGAEELATSPEETARIDAMVLKVRDDLRMRQLFDTWDADGGGTVDLMELVVALHKFNRVMEDGSGLKRATQALIGKEGEGGGHELDMNEFTRFVVQFCEDAYGKAFDEMAGHMLEVAATTSERAVLAKANGERDVDKIMADDEEETELLRETVRGVEASVVENIEKIKTKRRVVFQ
jgi:hypothetical protein